MTIYMYIYGVVASTAQFCFIKASKFIYIMYIYIQDNKNIYILIFVGKNGLKTLLKSCRKIFFSF